MKPKKRVRARVYLPSTYTPAPAHRFNVGDRVMIQRAFPPGHRRTPCYIRGKEGVIERICGVFRNPEELAYGFDGEPAKVLYRVRFKQNHVWPDYRGPARDIIEMEIFEHWLVPVSGRTKPARITAGND
jgi:nitrile hydratase